MDGFWWVLGWFMEGLGRVLGKVLEWVLCCSAVPCCVALRPCKLATLNALWLWFPIFFSVFLVVPGFASLGVLWHNALLGSCALCCAMLCCAAARASEASHRKRAIFNVLWLSLVFAWFSWVFLGFPGFSCCPFLAVAALLCVFSGTLFCAGRVCSAVLCCACAVRPRGRAKRAIVSVPSFTFYVLTLVSLAFPWLPRCPLLPLASRLGVISGILFSAVPC